MKVWIIERGVSGNFRGRCLFVYLSEEKAREKLAELDKNPEKDEYGCNYWYDVDSYQIEDA